MVQGALLGMAFVNSASLYFVSDCSPPSGDLAIAEAFNIMCFQETGPCRKNKTYGFGEYSILC